MRCGGTHLRCATRGGMFGQRRSGRRTRGRLLRDSPAPRCGLQPRLLRQRLLDGTSFYRRFFRGRFALCSLTFRHGVASTIRFGRAARQPSNSRLRYPDRDQPRPQQPVCRNVFPRSPAIKAACPAALFLAQCALRIEIADASAFAAGGRIDHRIDEGRLAAIHRFVDGTLQLVR
jgi:hypothetical protein